MDIIIFTASIVSTVHVKPMHNY